MFHWRNLFDRKDAPVSNLSDPAPWLAELFGASPTAAGRHVGPDTALKCTAVACAVRAISEPCGQLPVHIYRRSDDGGRERALDHPASRLLREPNEWTSGAEFRTQLTVDALLHGGGFAFVNRVEGRPVELVRLSPTAMACGLDGRTGEPVYKITEATGQRVLPWRDILHIRPSLTTDGISGLAPVRLAREAIGVALAMEEHAARLFSNGARPSGTLETEKTLAPAAIDNVRRVLEAQHAGAANAGRTIILPEGFKFHALTFSSVDLQFLELRKYAVDEIARAFRVPPHMLYELGRATWGNAEEMGASFLTYSLMYWLKTWEGAIRRALIAPEERDEFYPEFLVDDLLRADLNSRASAYSALIASRVLNPNEVRAMENRPPYPGGEVFANPNTMSEPVIKEKMTVTAHDEKGRIREWTKQIVSGGEA